MTLGSPSPWRPPTDEEWQLLDRFVAGTCGPDEERAIQGLLERDPGLLALTHAMRGTTPGGVAEQWDVPRAWRDLQIRMAGAEQTPAMLRLVSSDDVSSVRTTARLPHFQTLQHGRSLRTKLLAGVGALALAFMVFAIWRPTAPAPSPASIAMREVSTRSGQVATVQLNDGTIVTIGPQTHLRIPPTFGITNRTVMLDGEAYFDVAQQSQAPFVVETSRSVTRVLGTRFNVRAYGNNATTVAVVNGKVSLAADQTTAPGVIITGGYVGTIALDGEANVRQANLEQHIGWIHGRFVFDSARVSDVFDRLGWWYGIQLSASDSTLARQRLTAQWQDRSLESVLKSLSIALKANVVRRGDDVTVYPR